VEKYELLYTDSFANSLDTFISDWKQLKLSHEKIDQYVRKIFKLVHSLAYFPDRFADVTDLYQFDQRTRQILIGSEYAIMYRVDEKSRRVYVGSLVSQKQMNFKF
jgi:plasmid stabilization system protein ParE